MGIESQGIALECRMRNSWVGAREYRGLKLPFQPVDHQAGGQLGEEKGGVAGQPRPAERGRPEERAARAKEWRARGAAYTELADALGVSRSSALNYVRGYPYRRKGLG